MSENIEASVVDEAVAEATKENTAENSADNAEGSAEVLVDASKVEETASERLLKPRPLKPKCQKLM
jgi:hypothetical protein